VIQNSIENKKIGNKIFWVHFLSLFVTVGYANNFMKDLGFVAPTITRNVYNPAVCEIVYDASDTTFYGYDQSSQWQAFNGAGLGTPSGTITAFEGAIAPAGYPICNGEAISRITYAKLYAVIDDTFGSGDGVSTFNLPDLRGRVLGGVDGGAGRDTNDANRLAMNIGGNTRDNVGLDLYPLIQSIKVLEWWSFRDDRF
jgi:phage-related tail fiber protein